MARETLLLVDAHSVIHQAYHAAGPLSTRDGLPTGAVYVFTNMMLSLLDERRPDALALAFDTPEPTFRHQRFPDYKAHRPPLDEDLVVQLPLVDELVEAFRWPVLRLPGYEADDLLATVARRAEDEWDVRILTADRDLCQLVDDRVHVLATRAEGVARVHEFDVPAVIERFGVPPERIPDWKALAGDASDNLPGVPLIGPKIATQLLERYGDLEGVLAHAHEVGGKRGASLVEHADTARLCKELATVCASAPLQLNLAALRRREPDHERLAEVFTRLEFRGLTRRLSPRAVTAPPQVAYRPATDGDLPVVAAEVAEARVVGLAWSAHPPGLAVATGPGRVWYLPCGEGEAGQLDLFATEHDPAAARARIARAIAPLSEGEGGFVAHDAQRLYAALGAGAPELARLWGDTHLAAWLLDPDRAQHDLGELAQRHLGAAPPDVPEGGLDPAIWRTCLEADLVRRIEPRLRDDLEAERLSDLYTELELPLAPVLARMMEHGVVVDRDRTAALDAELAGGIERHRRAAWEAVGREFNLDSPKQLATLLYEELGLQPGRKTKTGWSTDATVLSGLRGEHPVIGCILDYRELAKLQSTYTQPLLALSDPLTGRIRTSLNQTGTATGRLSSSRPNLQNVPVRGDWGERIRDVFRAPDGWLLLAADYSQIELRVLAHVSGDPRLLQAFREGLDVHALAAAEIFGLPPDAVDAEQRRQAKVLNFGVAYGIQAHGLAQRLEIDRAAAQELIDAYFARFPGVRRYAQDVVARAREQGYVQTIFGRRRRLRDIDHPNPTVRQAAERAAINMPIQGAAADIIKRAMLRLEALLAADGLRACQVLQVHDELLLEVPAEELTAVAARVRAAMLSAAELDVPLEVKVEAGERWGSLAPLE